MAAENDRAFDLFLTYDSSDASWVDGYLLPALGLAPTAILTEEGFTPGATRLDEFVRAVTSSRFTVVVLSPAFLSAEWPDFVRQIGGHISVEDRRDHLIPILLRPCRPPVDLAFRVPLDFTEEANWDRATQRLRGEIGKPSQAPEPDDIPCPYPGLAPYTEQQAELFCGRHAETRELLRRLPYARLLSVIGPSGSGKSSLVLAGLLPQLRSRHPADFLVRYLRPGAEPLRNLASALEWSGNEGSLVDDPAAAVSALLARSAPASRMLLVIDPLEEVMVSAAHRERGRFVAAVQALRADPNCVPLFTMRADFYPDLMHSELWPVTDFERLEIVPPRGEALREAIEQPARQCQVYLEPALVERLVRDAAGEPGVLPLLQETLRELWAERHRRLLTLAAYEALGKDGVNGMAVALATWADASLSDLTPKQQAIARRVFVRLVHLGEGRDDTRRQQPVPALRVAGEDRAEFDRTLRHLTDRRLLILSGGTGDADGSVDLAHEALITCWPSLQRWLAEGRQAELFRRDVEHDAQQWRGGYRDRSLLYRGRRLKNAREWRARHPDEPSESVTRFLSAGRRLDLALKMLAFALVAVVALGLVRVLEPVVREAQLRRSAQASSPMVSLPAGTALLGARDGEGGRGEQRLSLAAFAMDRFEVTNRLYRLCVRASRCSRPLEPGDAIGYERAGADLPVIYVTAYQAAEFCRWLGRRLPTGAEWERAARGTDGRPWPWGSTEPTVNHANVIVTEPDTALASVGDVRFAAGRTPEGIDDLVGNVWEWTSTPGTCESTPYQCPAPWNGTEKVDVLEIRGLSFHSAVESIITPIALEALQATDEVGFRCARSSS